MRNLCTILFRMKRYKVEELPPCNIEIGPETRLHLLEIDFGSLRADIERVAGSPLCSPEMRRHHNKTLEMCFEALWAVKRNTSHPIPATLRDLLPGNADISGYVTGKESEATFDQRNKKKNK